MATRCVARWPRILAAELLATVVLGGCGAALNDEVARAALKAADVSEINNVMSRHSWYHAAMMNAVEVDQLWSKRPDIVIARNSGYWKGASVHKYYGEKVGAAFTTGAFVWHPVTTGVIEVAMDRQTAKGVWYTPGAGGHADRSGSRNIEWMWEKYGVDFVREDGHWKIWHMKVYTDWSGAANVGFRAPPGGKQAASAGGAQAASGTPGGPPPGTQMPASLTAAEDYTYKNGYQEWNGSAAPQLLPRPPEPYRTFSDTWSYVDEGQ